MPEHVHKWEPSPDEWGGYYCNTRDIEGTYCTELLSAKEVSRRLNANERLRAGIDELKDACKDDPNEMGGPFVPLSWVERTLEGE